MAMGLYHKRPSRALLLSGDIPQDLLKASAEVNNGNNSLPRNSFRRWRGQCGGGVAVAI
jgi:hypothetical protein